VALAFGHTIVGVAALLNAAALDFVDRRQDVILTGTREEAIASAYGLRAAIWCDDSCLVRLATAYHSRGSLPEVRRAIIAERFRIVTGVDIKIYDYQLWARPRS
jgi:hypothetical protein